MHWVSALVIGLGAAFAASNPASGPLFPEVVVDVPGRAPSSHFAAEVFFNGSWVNVYVFETTAKSEERAPNPNGYFGHLANWTSSWVSSQLPSAGGTLLLRVRRVSGGPAISTAVVHPASAGVQVLNITEADGVVLAVDHPARVAIDMDGTMDATDTGPSFDGPPRHTFCWFVDAQVPLPDPMSSSTIVVYPGDPWPTNLNPRAWPTVILAPGVHRFSSPPLNWTIHNLTAQTRYFFCAGAVVHAALHGGAGAWGQSGIVVDGYGVLSGEDMTRDVSTPDNQSPQGIVFTGLANSSLRGLTLVDFPNHHIILGQFPGDELRNVKVMGWRANGDGVHVFSSWAVSDLFLRTQVGVLFGGYVSHLVTLIQSHVGRLAVSLVWRKLVVDISAHYYME